MATLAVGQAAPAFSLPDETGRSVSLAELVGQGPVVLYFYPKDDTPGCTTEACSFRDNYERFSDAGAIVVGVSQDGAGDHQAFKAKHRLPFVLLSDEGGKVAQAFGVKKTLGILPGRVTFVIDRDGVIQSVFSSQLRASRHVEHALEVVRSLSPAGSR